MKNLRISTQLAILIGSLILCFCLVLVSQMFVLKDSLYQQRYDMQRIQTESALGILSHYRDLEVKGELSREEAQKLAFSSVEAMRYNPDGYMFGYDYAGNRLIYPGHVGVGKNFNHVADKNGFRLITALIDNARNEKTWITYVWPRPGMPETEAVPKVGYSLPFEPWGMMVGTGAYLDDLDAFVWKNAVKSASASVAVMVLAIGVAYLIIKGITGPLTHLRSALASLADDNCDFEIPHTSRKNEIGLMARATQALQEKVRERHTMAERQKLQDAELEAERRRNEALQHQEAEQ
ncbi:cache domain-containing protein, partial [Rhizobium helianthi]